MDNLLIRNIAILGKEGCGKTTLVEALHSICYKDEAWQLYNNQTDMSTVTIFHRNYKINLVFVPGNENCMNDCMAALHIAKGAVLMIDAVDGVDDLTIKYYELLKKKHIPTLVYVNRMDKENANFENIYKEIKTKLGKRAIPFCYPMGHKNEFDGFINCITMKARKFNGVECEDAPVYKEKMAKVLALHNRMIESLAEADDAIMEKMFADEALSKEEIIHGLRQGVFKGALIPVMVGSSTKKIGLHTMLDMFIDFLPNPSELKPISGFGRENKTVKRHTTNDEPFSGFVFKTIIDNEKNKLIMFKLNSGYIKNGDEVLVPNTNKIIKVKQLYTIEGLKVTPVPLLLAGDIGCIVNENDLDAGMTICDKEDLILYPEM